MPKQFFLHAGLASLFIVITFGCTTPTDEWMSLFDGESLDGWKASENKDAWKVVDGAIVTNGARSHLFYQGRDFEFKNFEFEAQVLAEPGANSGIFFHTQYQEEGWPARGYEAQVFNGHPVEVHEGGYRERKLTGSLYGIRNVWKSPVNDGEWFDYRIEVRGRTIKTFINGTLMMEYTEPQVVERPEGNETVKLSSGTFALQCHDPKSVVHYKNLRVRRLPDDLPTTGTAPTDPAFETKILALTSQNIPLMDMHVHLKGGLTLEEAQRNALEYGYTYGYAVNCGPGMGFETDDSLKTFVDRYQKPPGTYLAMQAEGREWLDIFSKETIDQFDYVFTDAMTWTNKKGKRMQLWKPEQVEMDNPDQFMEELVTNLVAIVSTEPIDIYVNSTYLPVVIEDRYDELWTEDRMDRVIEALVKHEVAMEINNRYRIPSATFIKRAKAAGVKFTLGTNNSDAENLGRMDYGVKMIRECGLKSSHIWVPG